MAHSCQTWVMTHAHTNVTKWHARSSTDTVYEVPYATHCNTLRHTATLCNILQHTATHRRRILYAKNPIAVGLLCIPSRDLMYCCIAMPQYRFDCGVYMYIYMYICICVCIWIHECTYMYVYMYVRIYVCIYTCVRFDAALWCRNPFWFIDTPLLLYQDMCVYICIYPHTYICTYAYIYMSLRPYRNTVMIQGYTISFLYQANIYICIYTHTHMYILNIYICIYLRQTMPQYCHDSRSHYCFSSMYIHAYTHTQKYIYTHMYIHIYISHRWCRNTVMLQGYTTSFLYQAYICRYIYTHTHICTYIHIYIHIRMAHKRRRIP